jgi:hypothetical protein
MEYEFWGRYEDLIVLLGGPLVTRFGVIEPKIASTDPGQEVCIATVVFCHGAEGCA